uniref:Uncharacterized protein n=1 Tax=Rhizophora mucronata TaxID=61149 RepID=A0A2P2P3Z8_RHIMU
MQGRLGYQQQPCALPVLLACILNLFLHLLKQICLSAIQCRLKYYII